MPDPRVEDLERAAALHWQAPEIEPLNAPARSLYLRCGFRDSHRYHYMLAP